MCSAPSIPAPPATPPVVTPADPNVMAKLDMERKRRQMAAGMAYVNKTGGAGVTGPANTSSKTLLGS